MNLDKSILVVDDADTMRILITRTLKQLGCTNITSAANGRQALEQMALSLPDIVLTDIGMPEMNGLEFVSAARRLYGTLPIVILSAHGDHITRDKGIELGATDYLTKPLSGIRLVEVLGRIFPDTEV